MIRLIAAIDQKRGLAKAGIQPWSIPEDERYFAQQTKSQGGNVLVGHTTFTHSFHNRSLAERQTYLMTRQAEPIDGVTLVHDVSTFLSDFADKDLWVVGGAQVYQQVIDAGMADELYLTLIKADFGCDQFFPAYEESFVLSHESELHEENGFIFSYCVYKRK